MLKQSRLLLSGTLGRPVLANYQAIPLDPVQEKVGVADIG
jgi:hypothetical protein